jgi:hypothetical protein
VLLAGAAIIGFQVLGSVKNTQSKEYKKLKALLAKEGGSQEKRKVSFDTSEDDDLQNSENLSEIFPDKTQESAKDFNQEMDHQTLQQMIQEKLDSAQNSATRNDEMARHKKMKDIAARMETKSTKSYIS